MKLIRDLQGDRVNIRPLHSPRRQRLAFITALALSWPLLAAADCVDDVRNPKPAELEFHGRAIAALVAALPPAPLGAKLTGTQHDFKRLPAIGLLCKEQKEGDFTLEASRFYVLELSADEFKRRRAERTAINDQLYALTLLPPDLKAQRDALEQKASAGYAATDAARKAGDQATAKARETEAHGFSQQARDLKKKHGETMQPQADELRKRLDGTDIEGQKAAVRLAMNVTRLPGANLTIPFAAYGAASPGKSAGLKVHNVVWSVGGADGPLRQALAGAIDRARLQALVGKPLPGAAESETYAARAVPVTVADLPAGAMPAAPMTTASPAAVSTSNAASPAPPAPARQTGSTPPTAPEPAAEPIKKAVDAVNLFRGLLGR